MNVDVVFCCCGRLHLHGARVNTQVAGMPSDVRVVGYSVDKKTGDVSFCYEARVTGRSDDAAGEAALAYAEALGAGTGAYGGEPNPLQEAQFQVVITRLHGVVALPRSEGSVVSPHGRHKHPLPADENTLPLLLLLYVGSCREEFCRGRGRTG